VKVEEVPVVEAKPSFLGRFFGWFKNLKAAEEQAVKPVATPAKPVIDGKRESREGGKRRERSERGERSEKSEQKADKGERRERQDARPSKADKLEKVEKSEVSNKVANADGREPREPRPPKPPREPRPPRVSEDKPAQDKPVPVTEAEVPVIVHVAVENAVAEEDGALREGGGRRRGRRGGRRERERRENQVAEQNAAENSGNDDAPIVVQVGTEKRKPSEYVALPQRMRVAAALVVVNAAPEADVAVPSVVETEAVVASAEVPMPSALPEKITPAVAEQATRSGDGQLIQVETDPAKLVSPEMLAVASRAGASRRRARPREVYVENEPLVQVETRH
jgi:ribonuclease E